MKEPGDFGKTLRGLRIERELSQTQIAKRVGMTQPTISQFENGRTVTAGGLQKIAAGLNLSVDELLNFELPEKHPCILDVLTKRERSILGLVMQGYSNKAIADELFIEVCTVKAHLSSCYTKLGVTSRTQAIVKATEAISP